MQKKESRITLIVLLLLISFGFGISSMAQEIKPVADSPQFAGTIFTVDIKVEDIESLFGISFVFHYTHTDYIDALSVEEGDFLGNEVLWLDPVIDDNQGTVSIAITRMRPAEGVDGSGVLVKIKLKPSLDTPDPTSVDFDITEIDAITPERKLISITPQTLTVTVKDLEGTITKDTVLIGTYFVKGDIIVPDGVTLEIRSTDSIQTQFLFSGYYKIVAESGSTLKILGTPDNPVIFTNE